MSEAVWLCIRKYKRGGGGVTKSVRIEVGGAGCYNVDCDAPHFVVHMFLVSLSCCLGA